MSGRWTAARIRRAILLPKPRGAIAAYRAENAGRPRAPRPDELALLRYIAEAADLLDVGPSDFGTAWLLVPMPAAMLDALAEFEAELHDLEPDADDEPDTDHEAIDNEDGPDVRHRSAAIVRGPTLDGLPIVHVGEGRAVVHHADLSEWRKL